jgi:hypothetical protein
MFRLTREYNSYEKEIEGLKQKLEDLKANSADESDIKRYNEFIIESEGAKTATKTKLRTMVDDLTILINEIEEEEVKNLEEYKIATENLNKAIELFQNLEN